MVKQIHALLNSGLGNQMFEYAFGLSMSLWYDCPLFIYYYDKRRKRTYLLQELFDIPCTSIYKNDAPFMSLVKNHKTLLRDRGHTKNTSKRIAKKLRICRNLTDEVLCLSGWWQNETWFKRHETEVRNAFSLPVIYTPKTSVVVQVRRDDFITERFLYCDEHWYMNAVRECGSHINDIYFMSDDLGWCRKYFDRCNYNAHFIDADEKTCLQYMYGASNLVISNSTFGWWGAYMSNASTIVCPGIWKPHLVHIGLPSWRFLHHDTTNVTVTKRIPKETRRPRRVYVKPTKCVVYNDPFGVQLS